MRKDEQEDPISQFVADRLRETDPHLRYHTPIERLQEEVEILEKAASLGLHVIRGSDGVIDLHTDQKPLFRCATLTAAEQLLNDLRLENVDLKISASKERKLAVPP
jgi:hypothetical protein